MASSEFGGFKASEDIEAYLFVALEGSEARLIKKAGADESVLGITRGLALEDEAVNVAAIDGYYSRLTLGGTVAIGDYLKSDAAGKGVTAASGEEVGAKALEAGDADEVVFVQITKRTAP